MSQKNQNPFAREIQNDKKAIIKSYPDNTHWILSGRFQGHWKRIARDLTCAANPEQAVDHIHAVYLKLATKKEVKTPIGRLSCRKFDPEEIQSDSCLKLIPDGHEEKNVYFCFNARTGEEKSVYRLLTDVLIYDTIET